jgi:hypothetical protein
MGCPDTRQLHRGGALPPRCRADPPSPLIWGDVSSIPSKTARSFFRLARFGRRVYGWPPAAIDPLRLQLRPQQVTCLPSLTLFPHLPFALVTRFRVLLQFCHNELYYGI